MSQTESANLLSTVLVIDDDPQVGEMIALLLGQDGIPVITCRSGAEALDLLEARPQIELAISDVQMPEMDGMKLLGHIVARYPEIPVLMLTGFGTVPLAVEAMKLGAVDFLMKPFQNDEVLGCVKRVLARKAETDFRSQVPALSESGFVSTSASMRDVQSLIRKAATGSATVLVRGESGTGKELAARAIHEQSNRSSGPFVKIQCGALPETLLESELFGYEKGAFTGAVQRKPGRVEIAKGGTLFLDEIGDITPTVQVKLLRLLQDREFERLGGNTTYQADIRIVAATHRSLEAMIEAGDFRSDLFYRLNVVPIWMPPLRTHTEDIDPLARHFCRVLGAANGRPYIQLDESAIQILERYSWPGNVRQLQNMIERLVVLSDSSALTADDVSRHLSTDATQSTSVRLMRRTNPEKQIGKNEIVGALHRAGGNRSLAARLLGISRRTLYNKFDEYQLT